MEEEMSKHRPSLPHWGQTTPLILCKCSVCSRYCGIIIPISQPAFCRCPHLHCYAWCSCRVRRITVGADLPSKPGIFVFTHGCHQKFHSIRAQEGPYQTS